MQSVHALDELLRAVAESDHAVAVATPDNAVGYLGAGYIKAMLEQAREAYPDKHIILWADCGDDPGLVMGALREGLKHLVVDVVDEVFAKLEDIAKQYDAQLRRGALHFERCSAKPVA